MYSNAAASPQALTSHQTTHLFSMAPSRIEQLPVSGVEARHQCRNNTWDAPTGGISPGYLQANLIVLPSHYANDFALLCARNPVPCPLLASSARPGDFKYLLSNLPGIPNEAISFDIDLRTDAARYNIYVDGRLRETSIRNITSHWDISDHVGFLIGCSFSFENALTAAGLSPPHILHGRNVTMYRTNIPLCPAGIFAGSTYVVSMRMYHASEVEAVRSICRPYVATHGEPVSWEWDGMRALGIDDIVIFEWGDAPIDSNGLEIRQAEEDAKADGLVPVFWGCGVTPQEAVMRARVPGTVMGHAPGHMIVTDVQEKDVL